MAPDIADPMPIESRDELVARLESGCKPEADFRIGTEHEKFGFFENTLGPVPYEGERGIRRLLENMQHLLGWEPVTDAGILIGLKDPTAGGAISLEPGGQFELSGAPLENIHQTCREVHSHLAQLREVAEPLGIGFLGLGYAPSWTRAEIPTMPKQRYKIMTAYMPKVGSLGLDMMYRTCTVQVNLDFSTEADMIRKMRVGLALQPIATALFANSPFKEGKPNGFLSLRSEVWRDTDNDRAGMLPFVFEDGFGFERWVDYALDVPMYFLKRGETYHDVAGQSFRDFMAGRLPGFPGERATMSDWADHLTTIFPEVRLKHYIEMRGADGGPWRELCALPAFWVGLLYDRVSLDAAWDLVKDWTAEERQALRDAVPRTALKTPFRNRTVREVAREAVAIARDGLARRARSHGGEVDETRFIDKLMETAESGVTPAESLLAEYENEWGGDISQVFRRHAY